MAGVLAIEGATISAPAAPAHTAADVFKELGAKLQLSEAVTKYLLETVRANSLHDFVHLCRGG